MFKQMKKIAHEIYEEEKKEYNLDGKIFPMTIIEFYTSDNFKQKMKLHKGSKTEILTINKAGYHVNGEIYVYIRQLDRLLPVEKNLFNFIVTCYHEMRHEIQEQFDEFSYDRFLKVVEDITRSEAPQDYFSEHDRYSSEIGANLYAVNKAEQYMKEKYPHFYEEEKEVIENSKQECLLNYMLYDASNTFELLIEISKKKLEKTEEKKIKNLHEFPVLSIFLNNDLSMKKISEIIGNENFKKLDKRIVYAVLSSKSFLESVNFEELSDEELSLLSESLQYTNNVYQNQLKWLEQEKQIKLKDKLKAEKDIFIKCCVIYNYIDGKIRHKLNKNRNDESQKAHKESIPVYIEKTNALIRKRTNKGYITIDIFYIIGFILSILTITFLIISK